MNSRAIATTLLLQLLRDKKSLSFLLSGINDKNITDKNFIQELCYGVCRWYFQLSAISKQLISKPMTARDIDIHVLILIGLYQLIYLRVPPHAAVAETVEAARQFKKPWATKLINAVLRSFQRQQLELLAHINTDEVARYSHPTWLLNSFKKFWPEQWQTVGENNNQHPPLTLRVNQQKISRDHYLLLLQQNNISAKKCLHSAVGVCLDQAQEVLRLPGFKEGYISVQDEAAQLATTLLQLQPGLRVLDACAAPGGKTAHILESEPQLSEVYALDKDAVRLQKVAATLQRLNLSDGPKVKIITADANEPQGWWDKKLFDRILLDAPCSGTGVIRRHSDIKLLRTESDIKQLATQQWQLLTTLWPLLKDGGIFVYATCSILPQENTLQLIQFLKVHPDAQEIPIDSAWGIATEVGKQILTGEDNMDGFYYGCMKKKIPCY